MLKKACPDEEGSCYLSPAVVEMMGTALLCLITFPQKLERSKILAATLNAHKTKQVKHIPR